MKQSRFSARFVGRFLGLFALIFLLFPLLVFPLSITLHEGGHAAVALITTRGNVTLNTGFKRSGLDFSVGRLRVHLGLLPSAGFSSYARRGVSYPRRALINLAGPCVSLLLALSFGIVIRRARRLRPPVRMLCWLFLSANLCLFLSTILPVRYPKSMGSLGGWLSDGAAALHELKGIGP